MKIPIIVTLVLLTTAFDISKYRTHIHNPNKVELVKEPLPKLEDLP